MKTINIIFATIALSLVFSSCSSTQFLITKEVGDVQQLVLQKPSYHRLKQDDKITVSIWNHDDFSVGSTYSIYSVNEAFGKWVQVDSAGFTTLPKIGRVELGGLTCLEAADTLETLYAKHLNEPKIIVKVLNKEITVIGEVKTPGNYLLDKEKITLAEAIGKAEGFTNYSKTKEIQLIRDTTSYLINLEEMNSLYGHKLCLQSGDIINVPSRKAKKIDANLSRISPFTSAITAGAIVYSAFK